MRNRIHMLMLVLTAMIWGVAFVFQTQGGQAMGPFTFICLRFLMGGMVLLPVIRLLDRMGLTEHRPQGRSQRRQLLKGGVMCGLCLTAITVFQQLGLYLGTEPGKAGFLTACYIVLVPVLGLFLRRKCGLKVWIAVLITLAGLYLLCMEGTLSLKLSDGLVLLCSLSNAVHILVIDHYTQKLDAVRMSCIQFFTVAVLTAFPMVFGEMGLFSGGAGQWAAAFTSWSAWIPLLYAGILSSGVAFTLQCVGQQGVQPTVASLLMSLESVFSVLAGWLMLGQSMSLRGLGGCALIFGAVVLCQLPDRIGTKHEA